MAIDSQGRRLEFAEADLPTFEGLASVPYTLAGLWPETWTVKLRCNDKPIAKTQVAVKGTETVERLLVVE